MSPQYRRQFVSRWKSLLITIGDSFDSVESDIFTVVDTIVGLNTPDGDAIIEIFLKCVESFTFKTGIYASIAGILNSKLGSSFQTKICQRLQTRLGDCLEAGDFVKFVLLLRFYISLYCVKFNVDVFDFINKLVSLLVRLKDESGTTVDTSKALLADNICLSVTSSILWFDRENFTKHASEINAILAECSSYLDYRLTQFNNLSVSNSELKLCLDNIASDSIEKLSYCGNYFYVKCFSHADVVSVDLLSHAKSAIESFVKNQYKSSVTYRFYQIQSIHSLFLNADNQSDEFLINNEEIVGVLTSEAKVKPLPLLGVSTLDSSDMSIHDVWIFEQHILTTIECFKEDCKQCATQLLRIPLNSVDKEFLIVKVVFNVMLQPIYNDFYTSFTTLLLCHLSTLEYRIEAIVDSQIQALSNALHSFSYYSFKTFVDFCAYWYSFSTSKISIYSLLKSKDILKKLESNPNFTTVEDINVIALLDDDDRRKVLELRNVELTSWMLDSKVPYRVILLDRISRLLFLDKYYNLLSNDLKPLVETTSAVNFLGIDSTFNNGKTYEFEAATKFLHLKKMRDEEAALINSRLHNFIKNMIGKPALTQSLDKVESSLAIKEAEYAAAEGKIWTCDELVEIALYALFQLTEQKSQSHINRLIDNHWNFINNLPIADNHLVFKTICKIFASNLKRLELVFEYLVSKDYINYLELLEFIFTVCLNESSSYYSFWIDLVDIIVSCNANTANDALLLYFNKINEVPNADLVKYTTHFLRRWYRDIDFSEISRKAALPDSVAEQFVLFARLQMYKFV